MQFILKLLQRRVQLKHVRLGGTPCVANIARLKESVDADQREHGQSPEHGAQLHHSPTPHEGAVAFIPQNHPDDDLNIGQAQNKQDPGQYLQHKHSSEQREDIEKLQPSNYLYI